MDANNEVKKNVIQTMDKKKRNIVLAIVCVCIAAAAYLNWSYNNQDDMSDAMLDASMAKAKSAEETMAGESYISDYFAEARLTRQKSRDEALSLLETAASAQNASQETIDGAMNTIAAMASFSMQETQIENMLMAKEFAECVAFMSAEGVTIAVPAPADGLTPEQVARITDAIIEETELQATQITIIEVKAPAKEGTAEGSGAASDGTKATGEGTKTTTDGAKDAADGAKSTTDGAKTSDGKGADTQKNADTQPNSAIVEGVE